MTAAPDTSWPVERFYWAVLDCPHVPIDRPRPAAAAGLDLQFADEVPEPFESLHAVYTRLDQHRVLGCAARRSDLGTLGPSVLSLRPIGLPDFASNTTGNPVAPPQLLVGEFEPPPFVRARNTRAVWIAAAVVCMSILGAAGLLRRASHLDRAAVAAHTVANGAASAAMPDEPRGSPVLMLRLRDELDLLRRTRRPQRGLPAAPDATAGLASLLAAWPDEPARTDAISVTSSAMSLSAAVEGDAKRFLEKLGTPEGWTRAEPRVSRAGAGGVVQATVQFRREGSP